MFPEELSPFMDLYKHHALSHATIHLVPLWKLLFGVGDTYPISKQGRMFTM